MKDYSQMSDFEINLAVADMVLGKGGYNWSSEKEEVYTAGVDGGEFLPNGYFNPCNNPADAWPIIIESRIGIAPYPNEAYAWSARHGMASGLSTEDKNPLRAAMIVFLMMQDSSNANPI